MLHSYTCHLLSRQCSFICSYWRCMQSSHSHSSIEAENGQLVFREQMPSQLCASQGSRRRPTCFSAVEAQPNLQQHLKKTRQQNSRVRATCAWVQGLALRAWGRQAGGAEGVFSAPHPPAAQCGGPGAPRAQRQQSSCCRCPPPPPPPPPIPPPPPPTHRLAHYYICMRQCSRMTCCACRPTRCLPLLHSDCLQARHMQRVGPCGNCSAQSCSLQWPANPTPPLGCSHAVAHVR